MKVFTAFSKRPTIASSSGSPEYITHSLAYDACGNTILIEKEKRNRYDEIQSFKDECDIGLIVSRAAATGDTSILNKSNPMYGDFTGLPDTLAGMHKVMQTAQSMYDNLPKGSFDDFSSFLKSFSSMEEFRKSYFDLKSKDQTTVQTAAQAAAQTSGGDNNA